VKYLAGLRTDIENADIKGLRATAGPLWSSADRPGAALRRPTQRSHP